MSHPSPPHVVKSRSHFPRKKMLGALLGLGILVGFAQIVWSDINTPCELSPIVSARAQIGTVSTVVHMYKINNRALPATLDDLVKPPSDALVRRPYLEPKGILDPWGTKFIYKTPGKDGKPYDIYSAGPDGKDGTDDDVHTK